MASRDVATAWPLAQPKSHSVLVRPEAVGVSAASVDATLRWRDRILSSVSDCVMAVTKGFQSYDWTRSGSGLPRREVLGMNARTLLGGWGGGGGVAAVATSPVVLVGDITVGVMLLTVAGAAFTAVFVNVVAADAISLADAEVVTVGK